MKPEEHLSAELYKEKWCKITHKKADLIGSAFLLHLNTQRDILIIKLQQAHYVPQLPFL